MKVLLCVTGSVAAKLTPKMINALKDVGAEVKVVLTESSKMFIKKPIIAFDDNKENRFWETEEGVLHIELVEWADVIVFAPLTANTLAKMANGICDNLVSLIYRACPRNKPIVVAPAMNTEMWENPITEKQVVEFVSNKGGTYPSIMEWIWICEPVMKKLACGTEGKGAMANIDHIIFDVKQAYGKYIKRKQILGKK